MTIFIFGEAMLEYHSHGGASGLRYGGDTLNTAIHLARTGHHVAYVTAVGSDSVSDALVAAWADEGIDTRFVLRHPSRAPGIYAIHVDDRGERSFIYWRDNSAARDMFALPAMAPVLAAAEGASLLYFSLISLAILPEQGRSALLDLAVRVRCAGGQVAYDSNFRRNLWAGLDIARTVSGRAMAVCDIGLPTDVDERHLWGTDDGPGPIADRWHAAGCADVVVKAGERGCFHSAAGRALVHVAAGIVTAVDSSGAGDAFNAGYLGTRLGGHDTAAAIATAQSLAAWVVQRRGAIPAPDQKSS